MRNNSLETRTASKLKSVQIVAEVEAHPCGNCYMMCFKNADNLAYQVGKVS